MAAPFTAVVRSPGRLHYEGGADVVRVATETGHAEVYAGHAGLVGTVPYSMVRVRHGDREEEFVVRNGLLFMDPVTNCCRVLAQHCDRRDSIDLKTAKEYLDFLLSKLDAPEELSRFHMAYLEEEKLAIASAIEDMPQV